jgi:molybdenum cofactor synthesis domain-containing protein
MLQPQEARRIVLAHTRALPTEWVPLNESGGRILAEALIASQNLPPFPAATMDGFALIHDDRSDVLEIIEDGFAGVAPGSTVRHGTATRIMTGAPVPAGADAVVPVENTELTDGGVRILQERVRAGENIRPVGSDMRAGDLLLPAGVELGPAEIGLLASLGHASVEVGRRPRVAVYSTGDELVQPGETPGPGQIRDSNRFSLAHAASLAGAEVVLNRHVPDTREAVRAAFREALDAADAIITSGGVSMGDRDLVKALLGEFAEVHFRRVFMKPGKPLNFATAGDRLVFGLPGNPVSCLVSFHMFVRPALRVLQGAPAGEHALTRVRLEHAVQPSDRLEYQRARVMSLPDGGLSAATTGSQQSARLMSFVGANAFLVVPPGDEVIPAGSILEAILLAPPVAGS